MNPERIPPLRQSEITPPVHALDEDTSGTIHMDPCNPFLSNVPRTTGRIPYAGNIPTESPNPDNLEVSEISSLQHIGESVIILCSLYDRRYLFDSPKQILEKGKLE